MTPLERRSPLLAALAAALLASGCLGGDDAPPAPAATEEGGAVNATLPEGRGTAIAFSETNRTANGTAGEEHSHDYWQGREQVVVLQGVAFFNATPPMPGGEGSDPHSVAYVRIPKPALVYEGTAEVQVLLANPRVRGAVVSGTPVEAPLASPPAYTLFYRSAAGGDFAEAGPVTLGTPVSIPVEPRMTDMPHSTSSLWAFRIATDKPQQYSLVDVTVTVVRGSGAAEWPGHPSFYADRDVRVVFDGAATTKYRGYVKTTLHGPDPQWVRPEKLISYGTGMVEVFVNVTGFRAGANAQVTGFYLVYHNASQLDSDPSATYYVDDKEGGRAYADAYYHFSLGVHPDGMDSPYQSESRWGFRLAADVKEAGATSAMEDYEIDYEIKILAHKYVPPVQPE